MTAESMYSISNWLAICGWLSLIFGWRARWVPQLVTGAVMPLLLALLYGILLAGHWGEGQGSFNTLAGVRTLFSNDWLLLAGWVHYLAFDLFIGSWQVRDARRHGIPHLAVIPGLILTLFFGPVGLLLYFAIRVARVRTLQVDEVLL
jgi:hypothetical protein